MGAVAALAGDTVPWFLALAVVIGLSAPPLGAAMRVVWSSLTEPGAQRERAFSLDAVAEELLFVGGPVAITAIIVASSPAVGLFVTAAVVLVGTLGLVSSRASSALSGSPAGQRAQSARPLRVPGFLRVLIVLIGVGAVLGVVEIGAPALDRDKGEAVGGQPAATQPRRRFLVANRPIGGIEQRLARRFVHRPFQANSDHEIWSFQAHFDARASARRETTHEGEGEAGLSPPPVDVRCDRSSAARSR